jgi:hypothetical protein
MIRDAVPASADSASDASPIFFGLIFARRSGLAGKGGEEESASHCARPIWGRTLPPPRWPAAPHLRPNSMKSDPRLAIASIWAGPGKAATRS